MIIDIHTHAGRMRPGVAVDTSVLASMRPSGVAACVVAAVADATLLRCNPVYAPERKSLTEAAK
jgi:hypothetical protein